MMTSDYPRFLQTALNDTVGQETRLEVPAFEPRTDRSSLPEHAIGHISLASGNTYLVFDGKSLVSDLEQGSFKDPF